MSLSFSGLEPLARKLELHSYLSQADRDALLALPFLVRPVPARTALFRSFDPSGYSCVLLEGYAARSKLLPDGSRQIIDLLLRGDPIGIERTLFRRADHVVEMLTRGKVAMIAGAELEALVAAHPNLLRALWSETMFGRSIQREWTINVGRRKAPARVAHLLCEMVVRHEQQGLGNRASFELPLTQGDLADCTGLTAVHVNRVMRILTEDRLVRRVRGRVAIHDWEGLSNLADFDRHYLDKRSARSASIHAEMPL
jgi:CRP-like cAMP-binding protein